jgi:uncharacterized protein YecE (DUF72 family)
MPLIKSKSDRAFKSNIKSEIASGKPQKQAIAIAYKTKNMAKRANGGSMYDDDADAPPRTRYRPAPDARNFDSDIDYYRAIGRIKDDDDREEEAPPNRQEKAEMRRTAQKADAQKKVAKKIDTAMKNKDEPAMKKALGRKERIIQNFFIRNKAKSDNPEVVEKARKDWSEKVGKGKPAPFKAGGKVKSCW